jgi:hypothetical protein
VRGEAAFFIPRLIGSHRFVCCTGTGPGPVSAVTRHLDARVFANAAMNRTPCGRSGSAAAASAAEMRACPCEFGRFGGGVVNMIIKSGGKIFQRIVPNDDAWRALTPYPSDQVVDTITAIYEGTCGGLIARDKLVLRRRAVHQARREPA